MKSGSHDGILAAVTTRSRSWRWPAAAATFSLLTLGILLWQARQHDLDEMAQDFQSDVDSALRSLDFRVRSTRDHLQLLAAEISQGALEVEEFEAQARQHLRHNPELVRISWKDESRQIHSVSRAREGPAPDDEDLDDAAVALAAERVAWSQEVPYTGILSGTEGRPAVVLLVPVLRGGAVTGTLAGICSCKALLREAMPQHVSVDHRISLLDADGAVLSALDVGGRVDRALSRDVPVASLGQGIVLRLERHACEFATELWLLGLLCVGLTLGMAYGMFAQARLAAERQRAQQVLRREHDNLVNVLEAMADGVAVVSADLDVQYVNPVLERDFGSYKSRKCYEYFHGQDRPCAWCMMDDVVAGRTVHTEWCYPRNERTYDLIDTRIDNPDGSVSKLKMFRDITERVEAEDALRESEQRFHELFERAADAMVLHDKQGRIVEVNQAACDSLGYQREEFRALRLCDIHAGGTPSALEDLLRRSDRGAPTTLVTRYRRKDGSTFPVEVRLSWLDYRRERMLLASARDVTERERAERAIQKRLEAEHAVAEQTCARLAESESLHRVSTALLQKTTLKEVLDVVCGEAQHLTRATGSAVLLLDGRHLRLTHWVGVPQPAMDRIVASGSFAGLAVEREEPIFVPDLEEHDLLCYRDPRPGSLIDVPLRAWGKIIGVLDVAGETGAFQESDIRILSHFADQAAIAIQRARLRERAEHVAVLEERHRLARELHDSVTQSLYSASLYADAAAMVSASGKSDVAEDHLRVVKSLMREALLQMRLLIYELRPPVLEQGGLVGAVEARLAAVEQRAGLHTAVCCDGQQVPLSARIEEALYGFTLEALNNALKHAKARTVEVGIHFGDAAVSVEVADDGVGFDTAEAWEAGGMGLKGMRERLERLGGRLVIESTPRKGTRLVAEVAP